MARMMRWSRGGAAAAVSALIVLAGCNHGGTGVRAPQVDITESFETGLADWTEAGADLGDPMATWSATVTTEEASAGTHSLKLTLDNTSADAKIWVQRAVHATPGQTYDVELSFDFATADYGSIDLWQIIAGVLPAPPDSAADLPFQGDTGNGLSSDQGYHWVHKEYTTTVTADADGYVYVVLGVWGTWDDQRSYYVDNVHLVLTSAG